MRDPENREWQLIFARAYRMLAEAQTEVVARPRGWPRKSPPTARPFKGLICRIRGSNIVGYISSLHFFYFTEPGADDRGAYLWALIPTFIVRWRRAGKRACGLV